MAAARTIFGSDCPSCFHSHSSGLARQKSLSQYLRKNFAPGTAEVTADQVAAQRAKL
jgi:hypothetical protein